MTPTAFAAQLPRLSKYDPGAVGEGSLDPMGVAAVADRIAELLAPGLRARMSNPRFVTLSAVGAYAGMRHLGKVAGDGSTTGDIAFEWVAVEALVRGPGAKDLVGLPGTRKARLANAVGERLNPGNYLRGPRVFGFTGVYRPFSIDSGVLEGDGMPGARAEELVMAWETDQQLKGFLAETPGTAGARLRQEAGKYIGDALRKGESSFPPTGWASYEIARTMTPNGAMRRESEVLRRLVLDPQHEVRHTLASLLAENLPPSRVGEHEIADVLLPKADGQVRDLLMAAAAYERCATLLTNTFRRLLRYAVANGHGVLKHQERGSLPFANQAAAGVPDLVQAAIDATARVSDHLAVDVEFVFQAFTSRQPTDTFVDELITRHATVQAAKGKRTWLDELRDGCYVRPPYRDQLVADDNDSWIHPMRLGTIANFLAATQ